MAVEFVGGALLGTTFSGLYEGIKELIHKNHMYKPLFKYIKSRLHSLKPKIQQIQECNDELSYCSNGELQDLEQVMKEGVDLVNNCLKVSRWNAFKRYKCATKLLEWEQSLKRELDILIVHQTRDVKKIAVAVEKIKSLLGRVLENQSAESSTSSTQHKFHVHLQDYVAVEEEIQKLVSMGFKRTQIELALATADSDINVTLEILSQQG